MQQHHGIAGASVKMRDARLSITLGQHCRPAILEREDCCDAMPASPKPLALAARRAQASPRGALGVPSA
jgi:hypothetical protein